MNNKLLLVAVAIVAIVVLGGAFFFLSGKQYSSTQTTTTQEPTQATSESGNTTTTPEPTQGEQVELTASGFSPKDITIDKGTKVVWTNNSGQAAAINSGPHPVHSNYPPLNLGSFNDGQSLELTFNDAGTFGYHNHLNAGQTGSVTVK